MTEITIFKLYNIISGENNFSGSIALMKKGLQYEKKKYDGIYKDQNNSDLNTIPLHKNVS